MNTSLLLQQTRLNCAGLIATRKQKKWVFPSPWIFIHVGWKKLARLFFFSLGPFSKLQYENSMCCMDYQQLKEYIFHKILEHCRLQTFGTGAAGSRGHKSGQGGSQGSKEKDRKREDGVPGLWSWIAAAAKSLQLCLTLCDPIDGSPRGSPVPGILQARTLKWVAIFFSNAGKWKVKVKSLSRIRLLTTPWTAAYQAPPSMGSSRQEYQSGVPLPSPVVLN